MKRWTDEEVQVVRRQAMAMTARQIGKMIGRSPSAVATKAGEVGIGLRKTGEKHHSATITDLQRRAVLDLMDSGWGSTEIHRVLTENIGVTYCSVKAIVHKGY